MNIGLPCFEAMVYQKETWKERLQQIILIKVKLKGRLHLGEHRFAVLCDHGGLVAVEGDGRSVHAFLRVSKKRIINFRHQRFAGNNLIKKIISHH